MKILSFKNLWRILPICLVQCCALASVPHTLALFARSLQSSFSLLNDLMNWKAFHKCKIFYEILTRALLDSCSVVEFCNNILKIVVGVGIGCVNCNLHALSDIGTHARVQERYRIHLSFKSCMLCSFVCLVWYTLHLSCSCSWKICRESKSCACALYVSLLVTSNNSGRVTTCYYFIYIT